MTKRRGHELATAYHEAGHAVIALFLGVRVHTATARKQESYDGLVRHAKLVRLSDHGDAGDNSVRARWEKAILIAMAGGIAQRKFSPRSIRGAHTQEDDLNIEDLASRICEGSEAQYHHYVRWMRVRCTESVERLWPEIEMAAYALVEGRPLSGAELRKAINW